MNAGEMPIVMAFAARFRARDESYSMYAFDLDLRNDFVLKLAQSSSEAGGMEAFKCSNAVTTHNDLSQIVPFPGVENMHPAQGFGWFADRGSWPWKRGSLWVGGACWFDEWNPEGFPESAWVTGVAKIGWRTYRPFVALLKSGGFPAEGHVNPLQLDLMGIRIDGITDMKLFGEIHHEDGTRLLQ